MRYGDLPKVISVREVDCNEMFFYQYMPIKFPGKHKPVFEDRLKCFHELIGIINCDFIGSFGLDAYIDSYVYLTAKHQFQVPGCSFNRPGYHCDGFMTDDINYVWSDTVPTTFNHSDFNLTLNDCLSLKEMEIQADVGKQVCYPEKTLLRLNQFNVTKFLI